MSLIRFSDGVCFVSSHWRHRLLALPLSFYAESCRYSRWIQCLHEQNTLDPGFRVFTSSGLHLHLIHLFTPMKQLWTSPLPENSFTFEIINLKILLLTLTFYSLLLNLLADAFEICSSLTPLSPECFLYKQARFIVYRFIPLTRRLSFLALLNFYLMHLAKSRFGISLSLWPTQKVFVKPWWRKITQLPKLGCFEFMVSGPCVSCPGPQSNSFILPLGLFETFFTFFKLKKHDILHRWHSHCVRR